MAYARRSYLDHAASSPLLPEVRSAMERALRDDFGNPSSLYSEGRRAKAAIDTARERVAQAIGGEFGEIVFTGGGTEAVQLGILGHALASSGTGRNRILLGAAEHQCVLSCRSILQRLGYRVELLPVDRNGCLRIDSLTSTLDESVLLVAAMHANNELGTWQPVKEVALRCRRVGVAYFCDAIQSFPLKRGDLTELTGADMISVSAHKLGGPPGVGALWIRAGLKVQPLNPGSQEREMRGGTENVMGIVGFGVAATIPYDEAKVAEIKLRFVAGVQTILTSTVSDSVPTLPTIAHLLSDRDSETMLIRLDREGISASSGAACSSGSVEPSHVLLASGRSSAEAKRGLRFSFGPSTSDRDIDFAIERIVEIFKKV